MSESYPENDVDWANPAHVPRMVDVAVYAAGNLADVLDDDEYQAACVAALDAMPGGREAVVAAVGDVVRHYAAVNGWSDWVLDPATGRYPWDSWGSE